MGWPRQARASKEANRWGRKWVPINGANACSWRMPCGMPEGGGVPFHSRGGVERGAGGVLMPPPNG